MTKSNIKTKILFLGDLGGGGKERRMSELIRHLSKKDRYDIYLMLNKDTRKDYPDTLNYVTRYCEIDFTASKLNILEQIGRFIQEVEPKIIHSWHEYLSLYYNILRPFLSKSFYIAGFVADANPDNFFRGMADRLTYLLSDVVISNSIAGLEAHKAPLRKSIVIYNGFNEDRLPIIKDEIVLRNSLGVDKKDRIISMVGRMQRGKDYNTFLDAIKLINTEEEEIKFLLVGQGEDMDIYKERVSNENIKNVIFTGFRKDVEEILQISTLTVLCTDDNHKEGVSNVIMESLAVGTPVVATNSGGTPEIIEDGYNGYLLEPCDSASLTTVIKLILKDRNLHEMLSKNSIRTIKEKFSIKKMVDSYEFVYEKREFTNK